MINIIWPHCELKLKKINSTNHQHSQQQYKPFLFYKSKFYAQKLRQNAYQSLGLRLEHAYKCGGIKPINRTSKFPSRDIHRHHQWLNRRKKSTYSLDRNLRSNSSKVQGSCFLLFYFGTESLHTYCIRLYLKLYYSKTCLTRTPLGLKNLFSLDRCLVYRGSNYIDI